MHSISKSVVTSTLLSRDCFSSSRNLSRNQLFFLSAPPNYVGISSASRFPFKMTLSRRVLCRARETPRFDPDARWNRDPRDNDGAGASHVRQRKNRSAAFHRGPNAELRAIMVDSLSWEFGNEVRLLIRFDSARGFRFNILCLICLVKEERKSKVFPAEV